MGIDYSSTIGIGFKVDKAKLEAWYDDNHEDGDDDDYFYEHEALDRYLYENYNYLEYAAGGEYDGDEEFAVFAESTTTGGDDYRNGPFGVFPMSNLVPTPEEQSELLIALVQIGAGSHGRIGPIAAFNCS